MARSRVAVLLAGLGVLLALPPSSPAQWVNFGGPGGCAVTALAASGGRLFSGTAFGVFISNDDGVSWTRAGEIGSAPLGESRIEKLYASGTDLFAISARGLYRSTDGGANWTAINAGLPEDSGVRCMLDACAALYCGLSGEGICVSTDRGDHWLPIRMRKHEQGWISRLAALGSTLYALNYVFDSLYQSTDGGATWTSVDPPLPEGIRANELAACGGTLIIVDWNQGIFTLEGTGTAWKKVEMDWDKNADVGFFEASDQALLVQIGPKCLLSADGGASWKTINVPMEPDSRDVSCFVASGAFLFVAISGSGLFRSGDLGASWTAVETGFPSQAVVPCLAWTGTDLIAAVGDWGRSDRLFRSSEGSPGWEPLETTLPEGTRITCLSAAYGNLIAGTDRGLFLSDDLGRNMKAVGPVPEVQTLKTDEGPLEYEASVWVTCFETDGTRIFAGTSQGILLTNDGGRTWTKVSPIRPAGFARIGESLFAGGGGGLYVSKDHGKTWRPVITGLTSSTSIEALATDGKILMAAVRPWPEKNEGPAEATDEDTIIVDLNIRHGILISADEGRSWKAAMKGLPDEFRVGLLAACPAGFVASLENTYQKGDRHSLGLFLSTNGGASWTSDWPGRWRAKPFNGFLFEKDEILAATEGAGIWRLPLSDLKEQRR